MIGAMAAFTTACSSDDHDDITVLSSNSALKIAFVKTDTGHIENNLQVGDVLTYKYTLEGLADSFSSYEIVPEEDVNLSQYHQTKDTDYSLPSNSNNVIKPQGKEGNFNLRIKEPGNFKIKFVLKKISPEGAKTAVAADTLDFNAVKISAYCYYRKTSRYYFYSKLVINTGNKAKDTYLSDQKSCKITYTTKNNGNSILETTTATINFKHDSILGIRPYEAYDYHSSGHVLSSVSEITFKKSLIYNGDQIDIDIKYKDVPVTNYGQQDGWGGQGQ
jgi:hypothetical protein